LPNSPAGSLSMKTTLLRSGTTESPLENEDRCAGWQPRITESAGEPLFVTLSAAPSVTLHAIT
jgi:hypothetical protein